MKSIREVAEEAEILVPIWSPVIYDGYKLSHGDSIGLLYPSIVWSRAHPRTGSPLGY